MAKEGAFGGHSEKGGPRLGAQVALGLTGFARQIRNVEEGAAVGNALVPPMAHRDIEWSAPKPAKARSGPKGGRPRFEGVRPWDAEGISRAEYFRRRKKGA